MNSIDLRTTGYITAMIASLFAAAACCSCASSRKAEALLRESGERWVLVGEYITPRRKAAPPKENWIGTLEIFGQSLGRLIDIPMKTPDGEKVLFPRVAYNESRRILVCATDKFHGGDLYSDVWLYDLATSESRWIAKAEWDNTRGFAWSPDGSKVAFVASTRGAETAVMRYEVGGDNAEVNELMNRRDNKYLYYVSKDHDVMRVEMRTAVMQYDVRTGKLEEVADDAWRFGDSSVRPRRPVYSEDGNALYFVSMDRHVTRVDLGTREITTLPFADAIVVLTVKGEHMVYAREVGDRDDWTFEIVKVRLDAPDGSTGEQVLHAAYGVICDNYVSPSRKFILMRSQAGYASKRRLIDVDKGVALQAAGLVYHGGFQAQSTAWVSR